MQVCYIIFSCRNVESRDWTDEYKHHKSARISILLSQRVRISFGHCNLRSIYFLITYVVKRFVGRNARNKSFFMQVCYIFSCRNVEGRNWTDEYKHHKSARILIFCIHQELLTYFWTFNPPRSFHVTREVTLSARKSIPSKNNLRGITMGIGPTWGITCLTFILSWCCK